MSDVFDPSAQTPVGPEKPGGPSPLLTALNAALDARDGAEAFRLCEARLEDQPDDVEALRQFGLLHAASGTRGLALTYAMRACELSPDDPRCWSDLGRVYAMLGDMEDAHRCFIEALEIDPGNADAWHNLGTACKQLGRRNEAFAALKKALLIDPTRAETYVNLATLLVEVGQLEDAVEALERAAKHDPAMPRARSMLARHLSESGKVKRAEAMFRQSLAMDPDHVEGWLGLAATLEDLGEMEGARSAYLNVLRRRPDNATALGRYVATLDKRTAGTGDAPALLAHAEMLLSDGKVNDEARALVGYGVCKFHDRADDIASAARTGSLANAARRASSGTLDREALKQRVDGLISRYPRDFFLERRKFGTGNGQPVFIVGLPRSGTTLTEQILASHPRLHGSGELSTLARLAADTAKADPLWRAAALLDEVDSRAKAGAYLKALREGAPRKMLRISDKQPLNFFQLAFAALLFPEARVVHCRRDARDNALSIWMQNFNNDQHWSTDFGDLAFYREQYQRLMEHWREALPLRMLEVRYEDMVADLEGQARRLIAFLGAEWDPACLAFHESERAVQTPSRWQVRQPIYTRAVGRWRAYAKHLPELESAFADGSAAGSPA